PVAAVTTAAVHSARLAGPAAAKQKPFPLREALQKALASDAPQQQKHGKTLSIRGPAQGPARLARSALSREPGGAHALVATAAPEKTDVASAQSVHAPEAAAPGRKKAAPAPHASAGTEAAAVALARELLKNFQAPGVMPKVPEASEQTKETPAVHAGARKAADPKIHIADARHKRMEWALDETLLAMKPQRVSASEKDAALSLIHKVDSGREAVAFEPRKAQPAPAGPFAGAMDRLRDMAGSEMMKATGIILRDGGGEIKLVLKPESLGSVRIRMNLVDNVIEGRIIVDNPAVKQVFDGNINSLMRALTAEGFQTASLQVSVGGQNTDNGKEEREAPPRVRRVTAQDFERNVPGIETMSLDDLLVNLFV
ncbi:MAG TPA: flagellar hook-length control protein FliK, partial [Spirochaetia bacterium]|nr:flagellar hook-length control protein FliK [Spirochaetia bacterium]